MTHRTLLQILREQMNLEHTDTGSLEAPLLFHERSLTALHVSSCEVLYRSSVWQNYHKTILILHQPSPTVVLISSASS